MIDYDLELQRQHVAFRRALDIDPWHQVLDIGCGSGETTRDAARSAREGHAFGLDRSQAMIQRARALTLAESLANVSYECADVEQYTFAVRHFDRTISRFGTMFFADPISAFTRICLALKPRARLMMIVWQGREQNEWALEIGRALAADSDAPAIWQPFSLGDSAATQHVLHTAGFSDVTFDEVHEPVFYGADTEQAFAFVSQFLLVQETLKGLNDGERERARDRLRALLDRHGSSDGVWLDSRAWIVRARAV